MALGRAIRRRGLGVLLVFAVFAAARPVDATTYDTVDVTCPACTRSFEATKLTSSNTYGGIDADGCTQANGETPFAHFVRVCPHCLCARTMMEEADAPKNDAARSFLAAQAASRTFPPEASQASIPVDEKFRLAIGLLEAEGVHGAKRAALWLRGAWALRGEMREALIHPEHGWDDAVPEAWRELVGRADSAEEILDRHAAGTRTDAGREITAALALRASAKDEAPEALRRLLAAVVLRCHGELAAAAPEIAALAAPPAKPAGGADAPADPLAAWIASTAASLARSADRERVMLRAFVACLPARGKEATLSPHDAWLLAEVHRRLGEDADAAKCIARAVGAADFPDATLVLLGDAAVWAGKTSPSWRTAVEKAWTARRARLVESLRDADRGEEAARTIAALADPQVLPSLEKAVASEDAELAARAAIALAGFDAPSKAVVAAVERRVADAAQPVDVRAEGMRALTAWASPSSAAVFRTVLARDDDDYLHDDAVRGLGLTGEPADAAAMIAVEVDEAATRTAALGLLAGRTFESVREFETWSKEQPDGADWAREALRAAAKNPEAIEGPGAVAGLADLLESTNLPIRWNAFRALRKLTGASLGIREVRYEGVFASPESPNVPLDLDHVLGDGVTVSYAGVPAFPLDALGPALQPFRDRDGAARWSRAAARWRAHGR